MKTKTLKIGAILLSLWSGLNLAVGLAVTAITLFSSTTPILALVYSEAARRGLDPGLVAIVNAQAALANPCIAALCVLVLAIVWTSLVSGARWAWWALAGALCPLQAFGFVSDSYLGHKNLGANLFSTVILLGGLALTAHGLRAGAARPRG